MNTNFKEYKRRAQRESQKLTLAFILGILFSFLSYWLASFVTIMLPLIAILSRMLAENIEFFVFKMLGYSALLSAIPTTVTIYNYFCALSEMKNAPLAKVIHYLGGVPCDPARDIVFANVVEEMRLASGIPAPKLFILRSNYNINAFVLAGENNTIALTISQGALNYLSRDELQAVIAHEFAHIKNGDLEIYRKLSAILQGLYGISEWRRGQVSVGPAPESGLFSNLFIDEDGNNILGFFFGICGYFFYLYGKIIQAAFSRHREVMADAGSVQFTRHAEALISTCKKALALQTMGMKILEPPEIYAHIFFIRQQNQKWSLLNTHPSLRDRIAQYGGTVSEEELKALLFDMQESQRQEQRIDAKVRAKQALRDNARYPLLSIDHAIQNYTLPTAINPGAALLFLLIYYRNTTLYELQQNKVVLNTSLEWLYDASIVIEAIPSLAQIPLAQRLSTQCKDLSLEERKKIHCDLYTLFAQGQNSPYAWYLLLHWQHRQQPCDEVMSYRNLAPELARLFCHLAQNCSEEHNPKAEYRQLVTSSFPIKQAFEPIQWDDKQCCHDILRLRLLSKINRSTLKRALENYYHRQQEIRLSEAHLRWALMTIL